MQKLYSYVIICVSPNLFFSKIFDFNADVIGQIVEVSHIEVVSVNGKDTQKIALELQNHEYTWL